MPSKKKRAGKFQPKAKKGVTLRDLTPKKDVKAGTIPVTQTPMTIPISQSPLSPGKLSVP